MNYREQPTGVDVVRDEAIRPEDALRLRGPESLRDEVLLELVTGNSSRSAAALQALGIEGLARASVKDLMRAGLTHRGAIRCCAAVELSRRSLKQGLGIMPVISMPADAIALLTDIRSLTKEHFVGLYLNARNQLIHKEVISIGSLSSSIVHPREVFEVAVRISAASIIVAHNHPSGDRTPSRDDIDLTRRLMEAGRIMGIEIIDHIIVCEEGYMSLKERGLT